VRQLGLVDDFNRGAIGGGPDRAERLARHVHAARRGRMRRMGWLSRTAVWRARFEVVAQAPPPAGLGNAGEGACATF
jgi:hypothetical protein